MRAGAGLLVSFTLSLIPGLVVAHTLSSSSPPDAAGSQRDYERLPVRRCLFSYFSFLQYQCSAPARVKLTRMRKKVTCTVSTHAWW